ncbi:ATP-binding protein [Brevibacillus choshinensis]|uniref:histidine kinase n=1 Tax=Brevibacillus choshinensis TaxID=54911 RepID=A0ABX7FGM4_BRECH|nr:ATP-binding protein [Brevibacillus choshinensis]QRG65341.1 PAS domain S-box protein [Brevibacillus choshinensis]
MQIRNVGYWAVPPNNDEFRTVENLYNHIFKYSRNQDGELIALLSEGKLAHEMGLTTAAVKGKRLQDILLKTNEEDIMTIYHKPYEGIVVEIESAIGDRIFWTTLSPIYAEDEIEEVIGTTLEITERKRMEQQLLEAEELYRSLVEDTLVGVYIAYVEHPGFVYVNPRLAEIYGYTQDEMVKMTAADLVIPEERSVIYTHQQRRMDGDQTSIRHQFRGLCKNQTVIDVEVLQKTTMYKGKPAVIGILQDVTERKHAEELIRKSELLSVVGQMAAGVAHEIRNPLTSLKGFVQLLQTFPNGKPEYFQIMLSELDRIEFIISEFLVLAKPQIVHHQPRDIRRMLEQIVMLADTHAILHNVQIVTEIPEMLPSITCEEKQLKQVFLNLMKNAIESMSEGGVVTVAAKHVEDKLLITFTDQGCGIPEESLEKLGEPFFTTKETGTGLGLMVSQKIIAEHGGEIHVRSKMGMGTSMEVQLPLR